MHTSKQKQKRQRFYALKKHLRGKKSLIHLFAFLCFLCAFYAFLCVKQKRQHFYADKNISEEVVCLAFCAFYAFYMHKKHLRGGKPLVCVLYFLCFLCVWNLFVKKKKRFKIALIPSFALILTPYCINTSSLWYPHLH